MAMAMAANAAQGAKRATFRHSNFPGHKLTLTSSAKTSHSTAFKTLLAGNSVTPDGSQPNQLCDRNVAQHYGYMTTPQGRRLFFWFFESRRSPSKDPFVVWSNGGPGCSSLFGLFGELGPCFARPDNKTTALNPFSWNNVANMLFIDHPFGVGFSNYTDTSTSGRPVDSEQAAADFGAFIQLFMKQFPKYAKLDFHITGESYSGRYIPNMATHLLNQSGPDIIKVNLKSIALGNPMLEPLTQYKYFSAQACRSPYPPILNQTVCAEFDKIYDTQCAPLIEQCYSDPRNGTICSNAKNVCDAIPGYDISPASPYDVRIPQQPDSYRGAFDQYLSQDYVRSTLGVKVDYIECSDEVYDVFVASGDWMRPHHRLIPPLLSKGIRVLIYAGDADYACSAIGIKAAVFALEWAGKSGFAKAPKRNWSVNGKVAGESWKYRNFAYVSVFEAGHMVPTNQPERALAMITTWLEGGVVAGHYRVSGYKGLTMESASKNPIP
ncbi:alpha/beta-hydrolase [Ramicandelaber brevisporus]|nr:alpha/beta-hydrolase [Ramicandelaber brevisporus]